MPVALQEAPARPVDTSAASDDATRTTTVSVIIACRNAARTLGEQLEALAGQRFDQAWEVIVVDDDSDDTSGAVAASHRHAFPSLTVVRNDEHRNVARARNVGVRYASGEHLLFCDADDVVGDGWVAAMSEALQTHDLVAGAQEITRLNPPWLHATRALPQQFGLQEWTNPSYLPHAGGGTMGMTRALHEAVGPFDESPELGHAEAADYCFRAQLAGFPLHFVPEAHVHVRLRRTLPAVYRQSRGWAESSVGLHRKFAAAGMPAPNWLRGVGAWAVAGPRLLRVRSRAGLVRWVYLHGWRMGRLRGSVRNRMLAV